MPEVVPAPEPVPAPERVSVSALELLPGHVALFGRGRHHQIVAVGLAGGLDGPAAVIGPESAAARGRGERQSDSGRLGRCGARFSAAPKRSELAIVIAEEI